MASKRAIKVSRSSAVVSTREAARRAGCTVEYARVAGSELRVVRIGRALAWSPTDVAMLVALVETEVAARGNGGESTDDE